MTIAIFVILGVLFLAATFKSEVLGSGHRCVPATGAARAAENTLAVQAVVDRHADCSALVFPVWVSGQDSVALVRQRCPGEPIELRMADGMVSAYVDGRRAADTTMGSDSTVRLLFDKGVPFEAYVAGRDMALLLDPGNDSFSIIIFFKLEGFDPTKINLI